MSGAAAVAPSTAGVTITTVSKHLPTSRCLGRVLLDRQPDCQAEIAQRRVIALHALTQPEDRRAGGDDRAVLARRGVLDERVHLRDEALRLELHGILVHRGAHLGTPAFHEGAAAAAQSREHPAGPSLRRRVASSRARDPAQAVFELRDAARRGFQSVQETFLFGTGREWRRRGLGAGRVGERGRLCCERDRGETEQHGQAAHHDPHDPLGVASPGCARISSRNACTPSRTSCAPVSDSAPSSPCWAVAPPSCATSAAGCRRCSPSRPERRDPRACSPAGSRPAARAYCSCPTTARTRTPTVRSVWRASGRRWRSVAVLEVRLPRPPPTSHAYTTLP